MTMLIIHYFLSFAMGVGPGILMVLMRPGFERGAVDGGEVMEVYRAAMKRLLVLGTLGFLAIAIYITLDRQAVIEGRRGFVLGLEIALFHFLWWPIAMPAIRLASPGRKTGSTSGGGSVAPPAGHAPVGAVRQASLRPRRVSDDLGPMMRLMPFGIAGLGLGVTLWRGLGIPAESSYPLGSLVFTMGAMIVLVAYGLWIRLEVEAPQPLQGSGEDLRRLENALERQRRFRVRGVFVVQQLFVAVMFGSGVLWIEVARGTVDESIVGVVGAIGGSFVGLVGATFGVAGSMRAQEVQSVRNHIAASQ